MSRLGFLVVAVLASLLVGGTAHAQDAAQSITPTDCPAPRDSASATRSEAARLFEAAEHESAALRVGAAAHDFACSYALIATAQAAYNAGVAYEGVDEAIRARHWFRHYLERAPEAADRAEVEQRIAALDVRVAAVEARERAAREAAQAAEARASARAAESARADAARADAARAEDERTRAAREEPRSLGTLGVIGVIGGGAGAAAIGTGFVLYAVAGGVHADFVAGGRVDGSLALAGQALDVGASTLWIGGSVFLLAGAGLVLFQLFGPRSERTPGVARVLPYVAPRFGTTELGLAGSF